MLKMQKIFHSKQTHHHNYNNPNRVFEVPKQPVETEEVYKYLWKQQGNKRRIVSSKVVNDVTTIMLNQAVIAADTHKTRNSYLGSQDSHGVHDGNIRIIHLPHLEKKR